MNARTQNASTSASVNSAMMLLLEVEMPNTTAFELFETRFDESLLELEDRFSEFVTRDSLAGSIGR